MSIQPRSSVVQSLQKLVPEATAGYTHAYVFPNLFLSVTSRLVGFASHFIPASAGETVLEWELYEMPLLLQQRAPVRDYIRKSAIDFTNKVLAEDKVLLELCQKGIRHARAGHQLQPVETRIAHFHDIYSERMNDF